MTGYWINCGTGSKWLIFMTDLGFMFLTLHYVIDAILVVCRFTWERCNPDETYHRGPRLNVFYKFSWAWQNAFFDAALFITIVYWTALHPFVVQSHLLTTPAKKALNFFAHGFNSISILIDIFVSGRPHRIPHFCFSILFGVLYMVFSVSYWAAGGLGTCKTCDQDCVDEENNKTNGGCFENNGCVWVDEKEHLMCYTYIYPITDWGNHPGLAAITVVIGVVMLPICHMIWLGVYKLRTLIFEKTYGQRRRQELDEPRPELHEHPLL